MNATLHQQNCKDYLAGRGSTYEFRCNRYEAVRTKMNQLGFILCDDTVIDVGAGTQDFGKYIDSKGFSGIYVPVDGAIDGTDLNVWRPPAYGDIFVAIEVLEHLYDPWRLVEEMENLALKGIVITTPNSAVVDTLAIDPTHVYPLYEGDFKARGWQTEITSLFCKPDDTIIAWYRP